MHEHFKYCWSDGEVDKVHIYKNYSTIMAGKKMDKLDTMRMERLNYQPLNRCLCSLASPGY